MRIVLLVLLSVISLVSQGQKNESNVEINLNDKSLKSIPDSIFDMVNITYLDLGGRATIYPPLSALLDSNANRITDLTEKIGNLKNLRTLILSCNKLSSLPKSFVLLQNLEILDLSLNTQLDLLGELDKLKQLKKLKTLKIAFLPIADDDLNKIKNSLSPNLKIISTASEYIKSVN